MPPIVNLFAAEMTVESEEMISFAQAGFGLHLEFAKNGSVYKKERIAEQCVAFPIESLVFDAGTASVKMCSETIASANNGVGEHVAGIGLLVDSEVRFAVQVSMGSRWWVRHFRGFLTTGSGSRLQSRSVVRKEEAMLAVERGMDNILELCGNNLSVADSSEYYEGANVQAVENFVIRRKELACWTSVEEEPKNVNSVFKVIEEFVTELHTEKMMGKARTSNGTEGELSDVSNEEFWRRRTRIVGIKMLTILAGIAVVAQVMAGWDMNNDVNDGNERMVKERIGLEICGLLLEERMSETVVRYNLQRIYSKAHTVE